MRRSAVFELGRRVEAAAALAPLARALDDEDREVRSAAAFELGDTDRDDAVAPLARALHDPDEQVRIMAARSLGRLGRAEAVAALIELARTEPPVSQARAAIAYSLKRLGAAEEVGGDRRIHPYVFYGLGVLLFAGGVWLTQARDVGTTGVIVALAGIALLLVARIQVVRHSHDRQLWVVDPSGGDSVWIAASASVAGGGVWGDLGGVDGGGGGDGGGG